MSRKFIPASTLLAGLLSCVAIGPAWTQTLGQGGAVETPWWRVAGALILCLGLAVAAALLLKKHLGGGTPVLFSNKPRRLQLVDTLRLSHQVDLCVVHYGGKELLVAASAGGASLLASADKPEDPATTA